MDINQHPLHYHEPQASQEGDYLFPPNWSKDDSLFVGGAALGGMVGDLLAPDKLAAERATLLQQENDPDFDDRRVSGWHYGFMERLPKSLIMRSSDDRAAMLTKRIDDSPRLAERAFVSVEELLELGDETKAVVVERVADDPLIELPLDNFVYAEGFESWQDGRGSAVKIEDSPAAHKRTSSETIAAYKERTTEAPPLEAVVGFVQPNGIVVFAAQEGSHRTGAAIARGDASIKTIKLKLLPIGKDYFDLDAARPQPPVRALT